MSNRLDNLLKESAEVKILTIKVSMEMAEELKEKAKNLKLPRSKLVAELFMAGYESFKEKTEG